MNKKKIEIPYFISKLPEQAQKLFHDDPKQFRTLYRTTLIDIVKQDLMKMVDFVTPVYEVVFCSDWYDTWHHEYYWYNIKKDNRNEAIDMFNTYSYESTSNMKKYSQVEAKDMDFFKLLRVIYYYINYKNKDKWEMSGIRTLNPDQRDARPKILVDDFVKEDYNYKRKTTKLKMFKTKTELGKILKQGCEEIANSLINDEIDRVITINEQIKAAKATLAKYGTELVKGY